MITQQSYPHQINAIKSITYTVEPEWDYIDSVHGLATHLNHILRVKFTDGTVLEAENVKIYKEEV